MQIYAHIFTPATSTTPAYRVTDILACDVTHDLWGGSSASVQLSSTSDAFNEITVGNRISIFAKQRDGLNWTLLFDGLVTTTKLDTLECAGLEVELERVSTGIGREYDNETIADAFTSVIGLSSWSGTLTGGSRITINYADETIFSALKRLCEYDAQFIRRNNARTVTGGVSDLATRRGVETGAFGTQKVVRFIAGDTAGSLAEDTTLIFTAMPDVTTSDNDIVNIVYPIMRADGQAATMYGTTYLSTLYDHVTEQVSGIVYDGWEDTTSSATYGERIERKAFEWVMPLDGNPASLTLARNTLAKEAETYLTYMANPLTIVSGQVTGSDVLGLLDRAWIGDKVYLKIIYPCCRDPLSASYYLQSLSISIRPDSLTASVELVSFLRPTKNRPAVLSNKLEDIKNDTIGEGGRNRRMSVSLPPIANPVEEGGGGGGEEIDDNGNTLPPVPTLPIDSNAVCKAANYIYLQIYNSAGSGSGKLKDLYDACIAAAAIVPATYPTDADAKAAVVTDQLENVGGWDMTLITALVSDIYDDRTNAATRYTAYANISGDAIQDGLHCTENNRQAYADFLLFNGTLTQTERDLFSDFVLAISNALWRRWIGLGTVLGSGSCTSCDNTCTTYDMTVQPPDTQRGSGAEDVGFFTAAGFGNQDYSISGELVKGGVLDWDFGIAGLSITRIRMWVKVDAARPGPGTAESSLIMYDTSGSEITRVDGQVGTYILDYDPVSPVTVGSIRTRVQGGRGASNDALITLVQICTA